MAQNETSILGFCSPSDIPEARPNINGNTARICSEFIQSGNECAFITCDTSYDAEKMCGNIRRAVKKHDMPIKATRRKNVAYLINETLSKGGVNV